MRVLVYDQFWSTLGGGEKYAGAIAETLTADGHEVDLLAHEPIDLDLLQERLALHLDGVGVEVVPGSPDAVSDASGAYDLFVNASYLSAARSAAAHSLYVVYFPTLLQLDRSSPRRWFARHGRRLLQADPSPVRVDGLHAPDLLRRHAARWTAGVAEARIKASPGEVVPVSIALGRYHDPSLGPIEVRAVSDGEVLGEVVVQPVVRRTDLRRVTWLRFEVRGRPDGRPVQVEVRSPSHSPAQLWASSDTRQLGVPVLGYHAGRGPRARIAAAFPGLLEPAPTLDFLGSYSRLLSISEYTRSWVRKLWKRESSLLFPPVTLYEPGPKQQEILSVGRFFARGSGHSKKQLEMVEAFRQLCDGGLAGWTLHLVGGCAPEHTEYVEEVRAAAAGLPVELHVGASGAELRRRYAAASVYWHATGLEEDEQRHPDRFEHFGITTVEAMSAGAVPVVIGAAGQREVVRDGVDGYWFTDRDGLVDRTRELVADPARMQGLATSARARANHYGMDAFRAALRSLVEQTRTERP